MMRLRSAVAMVPVWTALVTGSVVGCMSEPDKPEGAGPGGPSVAARQPTTGLPGTDVTVVPGDTAAELAVGASQALYRDSPLVLLAGEDDLASQAVAAPVAVSLGVPLLLTGATRDPRPAAPNASASPGTAAPAGLSGELTRLDPATVLVFGDGPVRWAHRWAREVVVVPAPPDPLRSLTVLAADSTDPVAAIATARASNQRHLEQIGSVTAAEVNRVVEWLAELTARHRLPQKLLVLHQFTVHMISDRGELDTGRDELAILIHADGFGSPGEKLQTWKTLRADPPRRVWWGWKNFYDEDRPTFTPARTVDISPSPVFISYQ